MTRIFKNLFGRKTEQLPLIGTREEMAARDLSEHIEKYAAAFIKETGLKASEVLLVQRQYLDRLFPVYEMVKKDTEPQSRCKFKVSDCINFSQCGTCHPSNVKY